MGVLNEETSGSGQGSLYSSAVASPRLVPVPSSCNQVTQQRLEGLGLVFASNAAHRTAAEAWRATGPISMARQVRAGSLQGFGQGGGMLPQPRELLCCICPTRSFFRSVCRWWQQSTSSWVGWRHSEPSCSMIWVQPRSGGRPRRPCASGEGALPVGWWGARAATIHPPRPARLSTAP